MCSSRPSVGSWARLRKIESMSTFDPRKSSGVSRPTTNGWNPFHLGSEQQRVFLMNLRLHEYTVSRKNSGPTGYAMAYLFAQAPGPCVIILGCMQAYFRDARVCVLNTPMVRHCAKCRYATNRELGSDQMHLPFDSPVHGSRRGWFLVVREVTWLCGETRIARGVW